jgi:hypothetical protein
VLGSGLAQVRKRQTLGVRQAHREEHEVGGEGEHDDVEQSAAAEVDGHVCIQQYEDHGRREHAVWHQERQHLVG